MQPDFYSGSAHKWPCGARECGVLFVNKSRAGAGSGRASTAPIPARSGFSRTFEGFGQRDEATMIAFREALAFQTKVGRAAIEQRARDADDAADGRAERSCRASRCGRRPAPELRAAVVSFLPGHARRQQARRRRSTRRTRSAVTTRGGQDRAGLRVSPHFYNSPAEVDRLLAALSGYLKTGV